MFNKRNMAGLCLLLAAMLGLSGCSSGTKKDAAVYVESVQTITGVGSTGLIGRYAGLVMAGESVAIQKDASKEIAELCVAVGDEIAEGDVLFRYNLDKLELELQRRRLELEQKTSSIETQKKQKSELEKERARAGSSQQLEYTLQIQSLEADIKEAEYHLGIKQMELASLEESVGDTEVKSPTSGRVMAIDESAQSDENGNTKPFISILKSGNYRIKGTLNELSIGSITEGMPVLIRSRLDESVTWNGYVESINFENPQSDSGDGYAYGYKDEMTGSSKYTFYVALDSYEGLIMGQHVYIEPASGDGSERTGLWLPEYYLVPEGDAFFVWAADAKGRLEKRRVELGDRDEEQLVCEIISGLAYSDSIAFPDETCVAGARAIARAEGTDLEKEENLSREEGLG